MEFTDKVRAYWDADAPTYNDSSDHGHGSPAQQAAWNAALHRLLPAPPSRVLDVGAGTGFLSIAVARLGHRVTALDLSSGMLDRLRASATGDGLQVEVVQGGAEAPPPGPFDAVIERHLLWTLPDPGAALAAWRAASSGVWNKGPISTSKPISAKAVAMTLAPRSCPSCPSLTTSMRGRRPSSRAKLSISRWMRRKPSSPWYWPP